MNQIHEEIIKKNNLKEILKISFKRTSEHIVINIKSEVFENFFKRNGINSNLVEWSGHKGYIIPNIPDLPESLHYSFRSFGGYLNSNNCANLGLLLCVGLKDGIEIIDTNVYSEEGLTRFLKDFIKDAELFYKTYISPSKKEVIMTIQGEPI